jgi:hypothetical protein
MIKPMISAKMGIVPDFLNGFRRNRDMYLLNLTPMINKANQTAKPIAAILRAS